MGGGSYRLKTIRKTVLIFLLIITLISVILINKSEAKYQVGKVYEDIVSGNVKNDVADFSLVSIYINGEKSLDNKVPEGDYVLDLKNTKCTVHGEEQSNISFSYENGKVGVFGINITKTKCNIYFVDNPIKGIIATSLGELDKSSFSKTSCLSGMNSSNHNTGDCGENTSGLYEAIDDYGKTYYYRGTVNNNWVKFGQTSDNKDIWWRIIRINGNNTIRLIYAGVGSASEVSQYYDDTKLRGYFMNSSGINNVGYAFNEKDDDNAYLGYMYGEVGASSYEKAHENIHDSNAKKIIDEWYKQNLSEENEYIDGATGFCGDRSISKDKPADFTELGYGKTSVVYGAIQRLLDTSISSFPASLNTNPSFKCPNSNDLYTTKNGFGNGNEALTYPIGLITIDEVSYAGSYRKSTLQDMYNYGYWLYTGMHYWTLSPYAFFNNTDQMFYVYNTGSIVGYPTTKDYILFYPVINLKTFALTTEGKDGTINNPYVVEI